MFSRLIKKAPAWLSTVFLFAALAFKDWENFFPLSAHSNLKFQVVGESLELLAILGLLALVRSLSRRQPAISLPISPAKVQPIVIGAIVAAFLMITYWRDSFPDDTFKFGETLKDVGYSLIAGVVIALFGLIPAAKTGEPAKEEENSAA